MKNLMARWILCMVMFFAFAASAVRLVPRLLLQLGPRISATTIIITTTTTSITVTVTGITARIVSPRRKQPMRSPRMGFVFDGRMSLLL